MSGPAAVSVITGSDELLVSRAVRSVVEQVATVLADGPPEVRVLVGAEATDAELTELTSPSLFPQPRVLVVRDAETLPSELRPRLLAFAADPLPQTYLVVALAPGPKGKGLLDGLTAHGAPTLGCRAPTRASERYEFVQNEVRGHGGQITAGACRALVEAVGTDLRQLAMVAAQLVSDTAGLLDEQVVARYHRGRAETRGFDVADASLGGDLPTSLALLRAAVESGLAPVVVVATLASGLRELAAVRAAAGAPGAIASSLRMPPWKVDKALRTARGWTDQDLAAAVRAVARADGEVKGAGADPVFAVERLLVTLARQRGAARSGARAR